MKTNPQISENGEPTLIYELSKWNQPGEIYSANVCLNVRKKSLTGNLQTQRPTSFLQRKWNEPKFIEIPSRDGKKIPAKIYLPANFDKSKKYPMVDFRSRRGLSAKCHQRLEQLLPRIYVQRTFDAERLRRFGH